MASLQELFNSLSEQVNQINAKVTDIDKKIAIIRDEVDLDIPKKVKALNAQLEDINEYRGTIAEFEKIASEHLSSKNFQTASPRPLNFNRLKSWSTMIDPTSSNDPFAQRIYIMCKCNLMFLSDKEIEYKEQLVKLQSEDISEAQKNFEELEAERTMLWKGYDEILEGDLMAEFRDELIKANNNWMISEFPASYVTKSEDMSIIAPGAVAKELPFPASFRSEIKKVLDKKFYDEKTGYIWMPLEIDTTGERTYFVSYSSSVDTKYVYGGLQNFLFRVLNDNRTGGYVTHFIDALHYNTTNLGCLKVLEDTSVLQKLPRNPEQIDERLGEIIANFADYEDILGFSDSVIEFNRTADEKDKLKRTMLFLVGYPTAFSAEAREKVQRILVNQERYGVSVVIADTFSEKKGLSYKDVPEYIAESSWRIVLNQKSFTIQNGIDAPEEYFSFYGLKSDAVLAEGYVSDIKRLVSEKSELGNKYPLRVDLENVEPYKRGFKDLHLPIAIDTRDDVHEISFENENFAHFLMGASGSGKSTLLHTIITGIIRNYHPDDVELWLADFKMSEFAQYIDPMPPHVKYILLDESRELVFDLIDRLTEKMMERQRFFMQHRDMKKVENVPSNIYMPVIFVILDEFSIMSQAVAESDVYKIKLQNLLAKGRALGIKFIFSSQTFVRGISGLTPTAKEQIQTRVAMKNSSEEITETLELSSSVKTEQVKNWIDALPPHYILLKYRDGDQMNVKRLQVMYFDGKGEAAMEPQRKLIRKIRDEYKPVEESEYAKSEKTYVDKHPVVVDGNTFDAFKTDEFVKSVENYRESKNHDLAGDELFASFGTPRLMVKRRLSAISNETRENILLVSKPSEPGPTASIVLSAMKEAKAQGKEVQLWAYGRNRLYSAYKEVLSNPEYIVSEGIDAICDSIRAMKTSIMNREVNNRLIVLLGMERICSDFELVEGPVKTVLEEKTNPVVVKKEPSIIAERAKIAETAAVVHTDEEAQMVARAQLWNKKKGELRAKYKGEGKSKEEIVELLKADKEKYFEEQEKLSQEAAMEETKETVVAEDVPAENVTVSEEIPAEEAPATDEAPATEEAPVTEETQPTEEHAASEDTQKQEDAPIEANASEAEDSVQAGAYDALSDFEYIIKQGSRLGNHFMFVTNSLDDVKQCGLKTNYFRYRLAFQLSADDSRALFNSKIASSLPEHICQFDDLYERYSFRPLIHKGIGWDGWSVDENGEIINPMV